MAERANVLLAGMGGREHAMAIALADSPHVNEVFIAPGNAGTAQVGTNLPIDATDLDGLRRAARENNITLATAGSENTFVLGFVDAMREDGVAAYGTDFEQTRLETDKIYSQKIMEAAGVPCPRGVAAENYDEALAFLANPPWEEFVIKASGPAGGKGVVLPEDIDEARRVVQQFMLEGLHNGAGKRILFQERLHGYETSLIADVSGKKIVGEPLTSDYKLKLSGNLGPNTGGMGCVIDLNARPPRDWLERFIKPVADMFDDNGNPINAKIYAQLIHTKDGIFVLEYNMRGGDPETQAQLALKKPGSDLYTVMRNSLAGNLWQSDLEFDYGKAAACLVLAAEGYPENPRKGDFIGGLNSHLEEGVTLLNAGTKFDEMGRPVTNGGRVLNLVATGNNLDDAVKKMYRAAESGKVRFNGMWFRDDIGTKYGNS